MALLLQENKYFVAATKNQPASAPPSEYPRNYPRECLTKDRVINYWRADPAFGKKRGVVCWKRDASAERQREESQKRDSLVRSGEQTRTSTSTNSRCRNSTPGANT